MTGYCLPFLYLEFLAREDNEMMGRERERERKRKRKRVKQYELDSLVRSNVRKLRDTSRLLACSCTIVIRSTMIYVILWGRRGCSLFRRN